MQFCVELSPPSSRDLTTVDRVKASAGQETLPDGTLTGGIALPGDDEIQRLITAASAEIEKEINRQQQLLQTSYEEKFAGEGNFTIMLSVTPIISIDAVSYKGEAITDGDWIFDPVTGIVFRQAMWAYTGQLWRDIELSYLPGPAKPDYTIDYTAGYTTPATDE